MTAPSAGGPPGESLRSLFMPAAEPSGVGGADAMPKGAAAYGLTRRQRDVLLVIQELTGTAGRPPSIAEIAAELEIASRSQVHEILRALRTRGWVDWLPAAARSLRVLQPIAMPEEPEFVGFFEMPALAFLLMEVL